jgi:hypothetical protein
VVTMDRTPGDASGVKSSMSGMRTPRTAPMATARNGSLVSAHVRERKPSRGLKTPTPRQRPRPQAPTPRPYRCRHHLPLMRSQKTISSRPQTVTISQ